MKHEGDRGTTAIHAADRIDKDDIRIEANGTLDELNALIEIVRTLLPAEEADTQRKLNDIQRWLMAVQTHVMTPEHYRDRQHIVLPSGMAQFCEFWIDELDPAQHDTGYVMQNGVPKHTPEPFHSNMLQAQLNYARTVTRRAERRLWSLNNQDPVPSGILQFINRLSDLFLTLARKYGKQ